ncbi:DeoR/GlpR family DNA-binding transcription regulator [Flavobacterium sp. AC]|uniref:DeoR/GlpR family DNA-binding transcription regulator n=1 Tax=Flavobacterium azizsancarii TaxID=2961580 RepID=A0ABT4W7Z6_9FLAO|nr:DeoR/GlpR family DNA-binding transcription regulator [Flavobacterium azizsancarii]MDA6068387.1 DeoR/GlpR family DNA-binding transcription regulator [Flavobacterium azizsancarii]
MIKEERFDHILRLLKQKDKVTYDMLAVDLEVSEDTIRRDIELLHNNGLLSKVRGGAIPISKNPLNFQDRASYLSDGKKTIALKARQFIKNGQTVFMDGGTTVCAIAAHLPLNSSLRIVTNNVALVPILSKFKNIEIIVLGGVYNRHTETNLGAKSREEIRNYIADVYFMGACAIQSKFGITSTFNDEAEIKRIMLANAKQIIVLGNIEKINNTESFKVCDLKDINALITDLSSDDSKLDAYRSLGIKLI